MVLFKTKKDISDTFGRIGFQCTFSVEGESEIKAKGSHKLGPLEIL